MWLPQRMSSVVLSMTLKISISPSPTRPCICPTSARRWRLNDGWKLLSNEKCCIVGFRNFRWLCQAAPELLNSPSPPITILKARYIGPLSRACGDFSTTSTSSGLFRKTTRWGPTHRRYHLGNLLQSSKPFFTKSVNNKKHTIVTKSIIHRTHRTYSPSPGRKRHSRAMAMPEVRPPSKPTGKSVFDSTETAQRWEEHTQLWLRTAWLICECLLTRFGLWSITFILICLSWFSAR